MHLPPNNFITELNTHTRLSLVAAQMGIAFIASSLQSLTTKGVVYRTLIEDLPKLQIALAWRKEDQFPIVSELLSIAKKCALKNLR